MLAGGQPWPDGWYELPLVLPFWRWLRLLPAGIRLHRTPAFRCRKFGRPDYPRTRGLSVRPGFKVCPGTGLINQTQASVQQPEWFSSWLQKRPSWQQYRPE